MSTSEAPLMPESPEKPLPLEQRVKKGMVLDGKYRIDRAIGSGGMGIVVAARHVTMGNEVAIKLLRLDDERDPKSAVNRFIREARATARIESEHVVRVTDVASMPDGTPYMVMELLDGNDLRHIVAERGRLPIPEAVGYVLQACEGLATAHAAGVIHRDLKPSNLFLAKRSNGTQVIKVLDFGISKLAPRADEAAATTTNSLMGSPLYMAPEQMRSSRDVDERADVWALGLILYELLAGDPPFGGETIPEICLNVMSGEPTPMTRYREDVPASLLAILVKCLAKDPKDRYPTCAELARALAGFGESRAIVHAERASAATKSARRILSVPPEAIETRDDLRIEPHRQVPTTDAERDRLRLPDESKRSASRRRVWIAMAIAFAAIAGIAGSWAAKRTSEPTPIATSAPATSVSATAAPASPPATAATSEVTSVPFDSLPQATRDAGVASSRPRARSTTTNAPSSAHATPPTPTPSSSSNKDDWKWGDRN